MTAMNVAFDSARVTQNQLRFMSALPVDIILEIFKHINQQDCLTCMTVCRDWDQAIPQYTQGIWRELRICSGEIHKGHSRRERCLGTHVKRVIIEVRWDEEAAPLSSSIQKLVSWGCTEIEQLECIGSHTTDLVITDALDQLALRLTHLTLTDCSLSISIPCILGACPAITHLDVKKAVFTYHEYVPFDLSPVDNYHAKLKYLYVNTNMSQKEFKDTLEMCPDLRHLVVARRATWGSPHCSIELDCIFASCSSITLLSMNHLAKDCVSHPDPSDYACNQVTGLRQLSTCNYQHFDQLTRHLAKNQNTLESLSILDVISTNDYSEVFTSIQPTKLRRLYCNVSAFSLNSLVSLLNQCPALDFLELICSRRMLTLDSTAIQLLSTMPRLRTLRCHSVSLDDELSLLTVLDRLPALEKLHISEGSLSPITPHHFHPPKQLKSVHFCNMTWKYNDHSLNRQEDAMGCFLECLTRNSRLETLQFSENQALGSRSLQAIATISTLKTISISVSSTVQDHELLEFLTTLGKSSIESLTLHNIRSLRFDMFDMLSNLAFLREFGTEVSLDDHIYGTAICVEGLLHMLRKCSRLMKATLFAVQLKGSEHVLASNQIEKLIQETAPQYTVSCDMYDLEEESDCVDTRQVNNWIYDVIIELNGSK